MRNGRDPSLSRRAFLKVAGMAAAGVAAVCRFFRLASASEPKSVAPAATEDDKQPDTLSSSPCPEPQTERTWLRFTTRARRVVFYAQEEAAKLSAETVGPEHLLLGLVREPDSAGAETLQRLGVSLPCVREEALQQVTAGSGTPGQDLQLTPEAKRVIDDAYEEAHGFQNNYVGTEHLLLGLTRQQEGLAARVLAKWGVDRDRASREAIAVQKSRKEDKAESG